MSCDRCRICFVVAFLAALAVLTGRAEATDVGGPILADTTWTAAGSPYIVTNAIIVGGGATLTIEPGVTVRFNAGLGLTVGSQAWGPGTLIAIGTAEQKVTFTSNINPGAPGQWKDIFFTDFAGDALFDEDDNYISGSILKHCVVRYAGSGTTGAVRISESSPLIESCEIYSNAQPGIRATNSSPAPLLRIQDSTIHDNPTGVSTTIGGTAIVLSGNTIRDNTGVGVSLVTSAANSSLTLSGNIVRSNFGTGVTSLASSGGNTSCTLVGNEVSDNAGSGISLTTSHDSGPQTYSIIGNTLTSNTTNGIGGGAYVRIRSGEVYLESNTVANNIAQSGGGFYLQRGQCTTPPPVGSCGAGLVTYNLVSNTIVGNQARRLSPGSGDGFGGGVYLHNIAQSNSPNGLFASFVSNTIVGNVAAGGSAGGVGFGGGLYVTESTTGHVTTINLGGDQKTNTVNVISDNTADVGDAIYNDMLFRKDGTNDIHAQYVCWGGLDPHPNAHPNLIYDFFDDPTKSFVLYFPHVTGSDCVATPGCGPGEIPDCNGNCAPASWIGDGICDDGSYAYLGVPIYFNCPQYNNDGGDCDVPPPPLPEPAAHNPPPLPTYDPPPQPAPKENNLIVVVHGRSTDYESGLDVYNNFWVPLKNEMKTLAGPGWNAIAYPWIQDSVHSPLTVLIYAATHGRYLGQTIAAQEYDHVHLVGHSAGSATIMVAAFWIKHPDGNPGSIPSATTVHTTYLDAYMGVLEGGSTEALYGQFADWSDHYYSREPGVAASLFCGGVTCTTNHLGLGFTQTPIPACHNADVTVLDPTYTSICKSNHTWPRCFYRYSIEEWSDADVCDPDCPHCCNPPVQSFGLYGFGLSKEVLGEKWAATVAGYPAGQVVTLGTTLFGEEEEPALEFVVRHDEPMDIAGLPHSTSQGGTIALTPTGFTATTTGDSPTGSAWITAEFTTGEVTNFIQFDVQFTSEVGAAGLLTVYVDGEEIAYFDERYMVPGQTTQSVHTQEELEPGSVHTFSFRLDQFGEVPTTVTLDNIATGWGGFVNPCPADFVTSATFQPPGDGQVDAADLAYLLGEWGANPGSLADIVTSATFQPPPDGVVDAADLAFLLGAWGLCE